MGIIPSLSFHRVPPGAPATTPYQTQSSTRPEDFNPRNPKSGGVEFFSRSQVNLTLSLQFHLEKQVHAETGPKFEQNKIDLSFRYEKVEWMLSTDHPEITPAPPWEELARHFSVDNTADRITQFVTHGYGKTSYGEANQPESRRQFVDFILPHVREGVDSALGMFGNLPPEIEKNAEATYDRIRESLEKFATEENRDKNPLA